MYLPPVVNLMHFSDISRRNGLLQMVNYYDYRFANWSDGQLAAERMCARFLVLEGYWGIDPQCPRGGPDGGKDVLFQHLRGVGVAGCYFPTTESTFSEIGNKFEHDLKGAKENNASLFAFMTGQRLTPSQKRELGTRSDIRVVIYDREALLARLQDLVPYMTAHASEVSGVEANPQLSNDISVISEIIRYCDFFGLRLALNRAPVHVGSSLMRYERVGYFLQSERFHLYDGELYNLVLEWWNRWATLTEITSERFYLKSDESISFTDDKNSPDAVFYLARVEASARDFLHAYDQLLMYLRETYPQVLS